MRHGYVVGIVASWALTVARAGAYVWLEGESGQANVAVNNSGWGNATFLSGGKWMHLSVEEGKVEATLPDEGAVIRYPFELAKAADHEVWIRIGFEFARSAFDWRIDDGEWTAVAPDELTTDLMEIDFFCEVAWLKLANRPLAAGAHRFEIRLPKTRKADGKFNRVLYACDAICIADEPFRPNGRFRPDESGRDAADEAAAQVVFELPEAAEGTRATVPLAGTWEVARDDEQMPGEVAVPISALPANPVFRAIPVPSDKNVVRKDLVFAHRLWYRTRVKVPASLAGRAFTLDFPLNNLNTTVFVNGRYCGFEKNPFCRFGIDVTAAVKPGEVNEVWVGIRDAWYGRTANPDNPLKLRRTFHLPLKFFGDGFQDLDYPIWNCPQSGILATPVFAAVGAVYAADVFVKPSVARQTLTADIEVANPGTQDVSGEVALEAVDAVSGEVAKTFAPVPFTAGAGQRATLEAGGPWADAKLWWPDSPQLYRLRTRLAVGGRTVDTRETTFGFREWRVEGTKFTLNGVVWHLWADLIGGGSNPEKWLDAYRRANMRTYRLSTAGQAPRDPHWFGMEPQEALDFFDRNGVVLRRNTTLDGETIGSNFAEKDPEIVKKQGGSEIKLALMRNWRDQCVAQVKGERNHPSIQIWTIENEFAYINLINLLGNSPNMDAYEREIKLTHDAVMAVDPTRSVMIDGGGALKDNSLGVCGDHYVATLDTRYPDLAYEPFPEGGGRGRWRWDQQRPRFIGEDFFATGMEPADFAQWGGEVAFGGKAAVRDAYATAYRILQEGYRWGGHFAAWHFWLGSEGGERSRLANAPRAVLCREWDWTFGSGQTVVRTFGVFNDTQYPEPLTFTRTLTANGKTLYTKTTKHTVAPGTAEKFAESIALPSVKARTEAELLLTLSAGDRELYRDTKAVSILAPPALDTKPPAAALAVLDPQGAVAAWLKQLKVPFTSVTSIGALPASAKVLLVGPNALTAADSTSTAWAAAAVGGRAVVVLDQDTPLKYQALPAEIACVGTNREPFAAEGRTAYVEDASHPTLRGLVDKDFFTWKVGRPLYRNAYEKPTRGAKSLIQVGPRLKNSALVEVPVGKGILYLCQLSIGENLADNAAARQLLLNLVSAGLAYKQEFLGVAACAQDPQLVQALDAIGLQYTAVGDPLAAISDDARRLAVVSATPANLATLAGAGDTLRAFWKRGGTVVFHGLTPEGLADYNRIVGVEHVLRPFARERVQFPAVRHPLTAGLSSGDIVMLSGKRIFGFRADEYTVSDAFTHIVDLDDIAPFGKSDFHAYGNIVNGFVGEDGWPLIIDFPIPADGKPFEIKIALPREETITELTFDQSVNYSPTTKIALLFDGADRVEFELQPSGDAQTFAVDPPRKARELILQTCDWQINPDKARNHGIDNIAIRVARGAEYRNTVRPMLNVGGLVHYAKGAGGVVLCNLNFLATEAVPANALKKRAILATVLRNLKASFAGGRTVIAGANLACTPLDIHTKATTYKDDRGWFGNKARTFQALPAGRHTLAGVEFDIYEMPTSPVPQVLMLGGRGVPGNLPSRIEGIPVQRKADALFFLHTARLDQRLNDRQRRDNASILLCTYVVTYADGQKVELPIHSEVDIEHYVQKVPAALPGAQLAWTAPYEGSDEFAAAYAKQWNNPRPDVEIQSVDLLPGKDGAGVPVLLALTAVQGQ